MSNSSIGRALPMSALECVRPLIIELAGQGKPKLGFAPMWANL